jgi:NADP-dependent 3-hydroxy acid dehydrogenase YdfG
MTENSENTARVALVTGATSGIGLASARLLAEQGHRVFLCARDETAVANTVKSLQNEGLDVDGTTGDVRSREPDRRAGQQRRAQRRRRHRRPRRRSVGRRHRDQSHQRLPRHP